MLKDSNKLLRDYSGIPVQDCVRDHVVFQNRFTFSPTSDHVSDAVLFLVTDLVTVCNLL